MKPLLCSLTALFVCCAAPALAGLRVVEARWRPDANPFTERQVWDGFIWSEGWKEPDQFYPKHFHPAGSLHVILRSESGQAQTVRLAAVDGSPIAEIATTPQRVGRVVWYWVEPARVEPNGWTECIVRLRSVPERDVRLTFETGPGKQFDVTVPAEPPRVRIESVSFSPAVDRAYVYLRALDGAALKSGAIAVDGQKAEKPLWTPGPERSGLVLAEVALQPKWEYGSFHLIEVDVPGEPHLAFPVRAWDSYFSIGLFGPVDKQSAEDTKAHGFNAQYWSSDPILNEVGLNYIPQTIGEGGRPRTMSQTGALFLYNLDEPDGHDVGAAKDLPYMDRLGVSANLQVIPYIMDQRSKWPSVPNMLLVDNTYKPLNWYVYGQIADIYSNDPYVPLAGEQIERVPFSLSASRDACAPHPLVGVIWATAGTNHKWGRRFPTLEEERMMAFYALGCGVKGIGYFADYEQNGDQEGLKAVSDNKPLWEEIKRINADIQVLSPYLSIGCPIPWSGDTEKAWVRALMCGRDAMVVVAVNKGHHIGFNTAEEFAWHFPAENVALDVPLPKHFGRCHIQEVKAGALAPASGDVRKGRLHLTLDTLDTARAFVITATGLR